MTADGLHGKIALVTGGAGSVGERIVRALAGAGATVLINCFHSYDAAKRLAAELTGNGHQAHVLRASVAKQDQVRRMFEEVERTYGRLDILVNNAAAGTFVGWDELREEHLDQAFDTNVKGALWCARAARPLLARADGGCVVNVSSLGATHAPANYLPVGVSKAALEALTRYLAAEFAADGIRVNTASAGLIDNAVGRMFPGSASMSANTLAATPLGRLGEPEDLAGAVMLLASPQSRWVTGQTVVADGGLSLLTKALSPDELDEPDEPGDSDDSDEPVARAEPEQREPDPVVVVGMGLAVPGASSPPEFWSQLTGRPQLFVDVPADRWPMDSFYDPNPRAPDKTYQRRSGFITGFVPHPRLAAELPAGGRPEFTARWLRHSAIQSLDGVATAEGDRYSIYVGYTPDGSQHLQESLVGQQLAEFLAESDQGSDAGLANDVAALRERCLPFAQSDDTVPAPYDIGRQAFRDLVPDDSYLVMVDTACSSSLYTIDLGVRDLVSGRCDIALCGGAFALAPAGSVLFSKVKGLSRTGEVRALDRSADGVLFSDGAGIVVLKRLSRALADGDDVLGVLAGTGLSADGKGKAIYAPSSSGQGLAISRALQRAGLDGGEVDWVVAHATGTPAGDEAEFLALRDAYDGSAPVQVTSNKSLVGHTGWAAGVVSVIHVLLALRHGAIPAQHRFTAAPEYFEIDTTNLTVPAEPVPWPAHPQRPRTAAVSGFGFGGTNAHVLVQEYRPGLRNHFGYRPLEAEPAVIVGWSAHVAGAEDLDRIADWARGRAELSASSFGSHYPRPPFHKLRMPASAIRATDRTQLMIVECMERLTEDVRSACERHRARVGVVVGHSGPTRNATLYGLRAYLDELDRGAAEAGEPERLTMLLKRLREFAMDQLEAPTEDSFPGEMPNVIAARLCNYYDFHGLNVAVDSGSASLADAFAVAGQYLEYGDIDLALVAGVSGNSLGCWQAFADGEAPVGEGAFLFAVTRRSLAEAEGLPVLAHLAVHHAVDHAVESAVGGPR